MSQMEERVRFLFANSIEAKISVVDLLASEIARAGDRLVQCLLNDKKILICGNGGSAANALHFSTALLNLFEVERPALPIVSLTNDVAALTAIAHDGHYNDIFARQIQAIGQEGDTLITLSTSGKSLSIVHAITAANDKGMDTIALNGPDGSILTNHLGPEDIEIRVTHDQKARVREIHLFILHCFCDLIDRSLFNFMLE